MDFYLKKTSYSAQIMASHLVVILFASISCASFLEKRNVIDQHYAAGINKEPDTLILWSADYQLEWSDFLGNPDYTGEFKKHSAVTWVQRKSTTWITTDSTIMFEYGCYFDRYASWKKLETDNLLIHEQGHFNLAEIYLRKLRKSLSEYKSYTLEETGQFFVEEGKKIRVELRNEHNLYDSETDFSKDSIAQSKWNEKIKDMLVETEPWSSTKVVIRRYHN